MTLLITAGSCMGSIAAMVSLQSNSYELLSVTAVATMASNSAFIAQSPARWCLTLFYLSVIVNAGIVLLSFFV